MSLFVSMGFPTSPMLPPCPTNNTAAMRKYIAVYSDNSEGVPESTVACVTTSSPPVARGTTSGCSWTSLIYPSTSTPPTAVRTYSINVVCDASAKSGVFTWDSISGNGANPITSSIYSTTTTLWGGSISDGKEVVSLTGTFRSAEVCVPDTTSTLRLSLIHISEPTRLLSISYAVFCLKKKKKNPIMI
eukprot:TRINITY_DN15724_c0_g2_i2.p1 TRINITY_DN15724_c0_g2~~TRINITY_DN15724_c0_g2_i2.p1  ORF type:complete len:188 (-),score=41.71 TRINITY_DN15724_c0_g2_i2:48-611(-)